MKEHPCFICGAALHKKALLSSNQLSDYECDAYSDEENPDKYNSGKVREASIFSGEKRFKFRKIQQTFFETILHVAPSVEIDSQNQLAEIPAELCVACEANIYTVYQTRVEITKLQRELDKITANILDSVISSIVENCLVHGVGNSEGGEPIFSDDSSDSPNKMNLKCLEKCLPIDSIGRKLYKKWRSKFCTTFSEKLEARRAVASFEEPYIEHYEEEISSSSPSPCVHIEAAETQEDFEVDLKSKSEDASADDGEINDFQEIDVDEINNMDDLLIVGDMKRTEDTVVESSSHSDPILTVNISPNANENTPAVNFTSENVLEPLKDTKIIEKKNTIKNKKMKYRKPKYLPNKTKCKNSSEPSRTTKIEKIAAMKYYDCTECGQVFRRMTCLKEHLEAFHDQDCPYNTRFQCPECHSGFRRRIHLEYHLRNHHTDVKCEWCSSCKSMRKISEVHLCKVYSRTCQSCKENFKSLFAYRQHRKDACKRVKQEHVCDLCSRHFTKKQGLQYHLKTHAGERSFMCSVCKKLFISKTQLLVHERIHTGEKPFICDLCGDNFSSMPGLSSHKKTHLGLKPYKCDVCNKSFRSAGHLNTHKVIHTGEKNFHCTICQKSFNRKENLRSHEYTHATNKPHKCIICPSTSFARASLLRAHMKNAHTVRGHPVAPIQSIPTAAVKQILSQTATPTMGVLGNIVSPVRPGTSIRLVKGPLITKSLPGSVRPSVNPAPVSNSIAYLVAGTTGQYIIIRNDQSAISSPSQTTITTLSNS